MKTEEERLRKKIVEILVDYRCLFNFNIDKKTETTEMVADRIIDIIRKKTLEDVGKLIDKLSFIGKSEDLISVFTLKENLNKSFEDG